LTISLVYFAGEAVYMVYRYVSLLMWDIVDYRPYFASYSMAVVLSIAPLAFLRQGFAADSRPVSWLQKVWKPQNKEARGSFAFVLVFGILFVLGLTNVLLIYGLPHTIYNAAMSIGVLIALWLFATNYINFIPGGGSVQVKLSTLSLTIFLALLGSVSWFIAPPYIATFQPNLKDKQTLRFTPNASGGYDMRETQFSFEDELGEKLDVQIYDELRSKKIEFDFPFYGKTYHEVYPVTSGVITFGSHFWQPNMQSHRYHVPSIFPLMIDLNPNPAGDGGVYVHNDSKANRLIITWYRLPSIYKPSAIFTFQVVLYQNGVFDITYNGLPLPYGFNPDETPSANPWVRGIVSGQGEDLHIGNCRIPSSCPPQGSSMIENFYLEFRLYLHTFMLPLAWVMVTFSLLLLMLLPLVLRNVITKPLDILLAGVRQMDAGNLNANIPVQNSDDIGFLTGAFNKMAMNMNTMVASLEQRVLERTVELRDANTHLQSEMDAREAAQTQLMEQQRNLAAMDERVRLSRDLHDGLGQVMGFINVQTQAAQTLLQNGQSAAASNSLGQVAELAQQAHADIRNFILGLRSPIRHDSDIFQSLETYASQFQNETGIQVDLSLPDDAPSVAPGVEDQVAHIFGEALANIRKHSRARKVEMMVAYDERVLQITISDDGVGFDERQDGEGGHFGLKMMRERAALFGGKLEVRSKPGRGTKVILHVPQLLKPKEQDEHFSGLENLRILLVDDSPMFLEGLHSLLSARGLTIVGKARDGIEGQEMARSLRPDVIIMDISMPRCNGLEATRAIKEEFPDIKIVMLTASEDNEDLYQAMQNGASGFLLKGMSANEFCSLLLNLTHDETVITPSLAGRLVSVITAERAQNLHAARASDEELTERQLQILDLVASGLNYKQIGQALSLSDKTVKYHMQNILKHLHLDNRMQAIAYMKRIRGEE
jgi:signal transduction histidine kinase/DNA-binding NarL/FixJ family response regulator